MKETPESVRTRVALIQEEARQALRAALESRRLANGRVAFPANVADRIAVACTELKPSPQNGRKARAQVLLCTGGVPRAIEELRTVGDLPEPAAGLVNAALNRARTAMKFRNQALAHQL
jgi:hypothetical protein